VVLGHHLALTREYSRYDVIKTIENALEAGFQQAFDDTKKRGVAGLIIGNILEVVLGAPLKYFLDQSS